MRNSAYSIDIQWDTVMFMISEQEIISNSSTQYSSYAHLQLVCCVWSEHNTVD
jgi:hypothetical protein